MSILIKLEKLYGLFFKTSTVGQFLLLLFFRLNWGYQFFVSGRGKLLNHGDIVDFFSSLHLPAPDFTAWFVALVELLGGIFLIAGLAARPIGLILAVNMTVAYLAVDDDREKLFNFFKDQDAFLHADPFFFLLTGLLAFCFGAGPLSLDRAIKWVIDKNRKPQSQAQEPVQTS